MSFGPFGSDSNSTTNAPNAADNRASAQRGNANVNLQDQASYANLQGSKVTTAPQITAQKGATVSYTVQNGLGSNELSSLFGLFSSASGGGGGSGGPPAITDVTTTPASDGSSAPPAATPSPALLAGGGVVLLIIVGALFFLLKK